MQAEATCRSAASSSPTSIPRTRDCAQALDGSITLGPLPEPRQEGKSLAQLPGAEFSSVEAIEVAEALDCRIVGLVGLNDVLRLMKAWSLHISGILC